MQTLLLREREPHQVEVAVLGRMVMEAPVAPDRLLEEAAAGAAHLSLEMEETGAAVEMGVSASPHIFEEASQ